MINKKTSNVLTLLVMFWTIAIVIVSISRLIIGGAVFVGPGAAITWLVSVGVVSLTPLVLIFANSKNSSAWLSPIDQILRLIFYALWLTLGLAFAFEFETGMLLILSVALLLALFIVAKAVFGGHAIQNRQVEQQNVRRLDRKSLFLALNALTIWLPLGFAVGVITYVSIRYADVPDSGLIVIPIALAVGPFLIAGIMVAIVTLIWQVRTLLVRRRTLSKAIAIWGGVWALSSVAYLVLWAWYLALLTGLIRIY